MLSLITFKPLFNSLLNDRSLGVVLSLITFKPHQAEVLEESSLGVVLSLITFKQGYLTDVYIEEFGSSAIFNYF